MKCWRCDEFGKNEISSEKLVDGHQRQSPTNLGLSFGGHGQPSGSVSNPLESQKSPFNITSNFTPIHVYHRLKAWLKPNLLKSEKQLLLAICHDLDQKRFYL